MPLPNMAPEADANERMTISLSAQQQSRKRAEARKDYQDKNPVTVSAK